MSANGAQHADDSQDAPARREDIREEPYGSGLGIRLFYVLLKTVGVYPAYGLLAFVIFYYACLPGVARACTPYLERRFRSEGPVRRFFRRYRYVYEFGLTLIDQAAMGIVGPKAFVVEFPGDREFYELSARREGTVLLTSHVGAWQIAMAHLRRLEKPVNLLMRLDQGRKDMHFFDLSGERGKFSFIDPAGFMGGLVEATRALRAGECVAVMGDRAHRWRVGRAPFLGAQAPFPLVAEHLAAVTGSRLIMLVTRRIGPLKFSIRHVDLSTVLGVFGEEHDDGRMKGRMKGRERGRAVLTDEYLRAYARELEEYVRDTPYAWFNFFDFWHAGVGGVEAVGPGETNERTDANGMRAEAESVMAAHSSKQHYNREGD